MAQLILCVIFIQHQDITFDESAYYDYTVRWAKADVERHEVVDDAKTPATAPALLPRIFKQVFNTGYKATDFGKKDMLQGRYAMWVFVALTSFVFLLWGFRLYGSNNWWLPLVLLLFDPLFFSYGMLIISDLAIAGFLFALCYVYWRYRETNHLRYVCWSGLFLGLALVTKLSMLFIVPVVLVLCFTDLIKKKSTARDRRKKIIDWLIIFFMALCVINAAYFFKGTGLSFSDYSFKSAAFKKLHSAGFINHIPLPLPHSYVQSIDWSLHQGAVGGGLDGSSHHRLYINGVYKEHGVLWYYYIVALLYKMPVFILLLTMVAAVVALMRLKNIRSSLLFVILPAVYFFIMLSLFNEFQTGIRHLLLIFPLWYLALGAFIKNVLATKLRSFFIATTLVHAILVARVFPDWIPYTNELLRDKKNVYKYIVDSSIDYNQSDKHLHHFLTQHPDHSYAPDTARAGKFIVPMYKVAAVWNYDIPKFSWLRNNFEPTGHYKYVYLLYDISAEEIGELKVDD